jgi:hypothetical protein
VKEESSPPNNKVKLVLCVRRLLARALRDGKGYIKRATPQDRNGALARRAGDTPLTLGKMYNAATVWFAHGSLLVSSKNYRTLAMCIYNSKPGAASDAFTNDTLLQKHYPVALPIVSMWAKRRRNAGK